MPMKRPGQRVEDRARRAARRSRRGSRAARRCRRCGPAAGCDAGRARRSARDVDELDDGGDDDRGERRLGQLLEQAGEEQQRDDRERGDDEPRQLRAWRRREPLTAVFDRLPLTTMPLERPGAEVRGAEAEQLAVGVDLVVVAGGVRLGRAEALGEADEHHADRGRRRASR